MSTKQIERAKNDGFVHEEINLQKRGWVVQRIGWTLMLVLLLLAAFGLFGEGPLSKKTITAGNIHMQYERFGRHEHETPIKFESKNENITMVSVPQLYLKEFKLSKVVPEPESQVASDGYINYAFKGQNNFNVTFYFDPLEFGNASGTIKVNSYNIPLIQTIYP